VEKRFEYDGLSMEKLSWQLPYGPRTGALFMKPAGAKGRLPAILALHDHGGNKYFGVEKISRASGRLHPMMREHQEHYYSGRAWANEIAKQGYAVLVPDAFLFASRRVRYAGVSRVLTGGRREPDGRSIKTIREYNVWASGHENVMAKSLFCAGTTWPGLFLYDDQRALDYLCSRLDVDNGRVGCGGLSGGGLRTVFLAGLDKRIKCAVCVGLMTTWRDCLLNRCHTHTWMLYVPHLPRFLDFPEILGLRVPLPTLVLNDSQDQLFTLKEMKASDRILKAVYRKAGAPRQYCCSFHPGPHKFDAAMQEEAFVFFDRHLKA
jgi:dienelactone hydrolase